MRKVKKKNDKKQMEETNNDEICDEKMRKNNREQKRGADSDRKKGKLEGNIAQWSKLGRCWGR